MTEVIKPKIIIEAVNAMKYTSIDGHVVKSEKGQVVNSKGILIRVTGEWVFRDGTGGFIDHDVDLNDLCERHNLRILVNGKE